jgi:hypothetical protein
MSPVRTASTAAVILLALSGCAQGSRAIPSSNASSVRPAGPLDGPLHTEGSRLVGASGETVVLKGAQIQSYNVAQEYRTTTLLEPAAFNAMRAWGMVELRLPFSGCLITGDPGYLPRLLQYAHEAEQADLYVVLAMFDDDRAGCPHDGVHMPHLAAVSQWSAVASAFRADPNVLFDLFNEPAVHSGPSTDADWALWKDGGSVTGPLGSAVPIAGFDQLAHAVRQAGATTQPLIAEAVDGSQLGGVTGHLPADRNVVYSIHTYFYNALTPQDWTSMFGGVASRLPVFVGEWAFLPNAAQPNMCQKLHLSTAAAAALVDSFLAYMDAHGVSYNAWSFTPTRLIVDETNFAPTILPDPMRCSAALKQAGMGSLYKAHLTGRGG